MKKGKCVCVYSPKGGVGKSVFSANLAGVSFLMGKKTLLIDTDIYDGGLSLYINEKINKNIYTLCSDIKTNKYNNILDYVYSYNSSLDILCSTKIQLEAREIKEQYLDKIINDARNYYDLIIIDTYSAYNDFNEEIFRLSDTILLILTNDLVNIKNMKNVIMMFKENNINKYKIIFNSSFDFKELYFDYYDLTSMINSSVDYSINKEGFFKNITSYLYNSKIPILYKNNDTLYYEYVDKLMIIIKDIFR